MEEKLSNEQYQQQKKNKVDSIVKKLLTIVGTSLLLIIPIAFMYGIINDRTNYRNEAVEKIAQSWTGNQSIDIPSMFFITKNAKKENVENSLELNNYEANVLIKTEIRKKGIFKVPVYTAQVTQKGDFKNKYGDLSDKQISTRIKVSDTRGFVTEPSFKINNSSTVKSQDMTYTTNIKTNSNIIPFEIKYEIRGLNDIDVEFGGYNNKVTINGNWKDPEFKGDYLPTERKVTQKDFSATWSVPKIALKQQNIVSTEYATVKNSPSVASVSLLVPVDNYSMAEKALKYGFLLLFLTFMGYFIYEITSKENRRVHPVQYCLLGAAILMFYLLLVSISELVSFNLAYFLAAVMVMLLIFGYTYFVITKRQGLTFSIGITALIGLLYVYFYVLLRLQDIALLAGSVGLFVIIATIMYLTRNVNWYNEND